jgi:hypothetical protein
MLSFSIAPLAFTSRPLRCIASAPLSPVPARSRLCLYSHCRSWVAVDGRVGRICRCSTDPSDTRTAPAPSGSTTLCIIQR